MKRKSSISVRIASILLAAVLSFTSGGMSVLAQETQANPGNQTEDENGIMGDTDTVEGNTDETGSEPEDNSDTGKDNSADNTENGESEAGNGDSGNDSGNKSEEGSSESESEGNSSSDDNSGNKSEEDSTDDENSTEESEGDNTEEQPEDAENGDEEETAEDESSVDEEDSEAIDDEEDIPVEVIEENNEYSEITEGDFKFELVETPLDEYGTYYKVKEYNGEVSGNLTIPGKVNVGGYEYTVKGIADGVFENCSGFTGTLDLANVEIIGDNAFKGCSGFTGTLNLANVEIIGDNAFKGCSGFTGTLNLSSVKKIGAHAFDGCSGFTGTLTIPEQSIPLGDYAFYKCSGFTGLDLSAWSLPTIGKHSFEYCSGLTGVVFPSAVCGIDEYAFAHCSELTGITFPGNIGVISDYAFAYCTKLTGTFTVPGGLSHVGTAPLYKSGYTEVVNTTDKAWSLTPSGSNDEYWLDPVTQERIYSITNGSAIKGTANDVKYHITYKYADEFSDVSNPNPENYKKTDTVTLRNPVRTGYTFGGWYTNPNFKTKITQIKSGSTGNIIIYAKWTANKYTIAFNKNGGSGSVKSMSCNYGATYTLRPNKFKRKGYEFIGWGTSKNSGKVYSNSAQISNLVAKNKGKITLYAQWKLIDYTYTYNLNAGGDPTATLSAPTVNTYNVTQKITFVKPTRAGYTFKAWCTDTKGKKKLSYIKKGTIGDKTLYASWAGNKYSIQFKSNGGKGTMKTVSGAYAAGKKLPQNKFTRAGYTFMGWSTTAGGSVVYTNMDEIGTEFCGTSSKAKKVTLYAVWQSSQVPVITKQPTPVSGKEGKNVSVSVTATGAGLEYEWQYKKSGETDWTAFANSNTSNFSFGITDSSFYNMSIRVKITDTYNRSIYSDSILLTEQDDNETEIF